MNKLLIIYKDAKTELTGIFIVIMASLLIKAAILSNDKYMYIYKIFKYYFILFYFFFNLKIK